MKNGLFNAINLYKEIKNDNIKEEIQQSIETAQKLDKQTSNKNASSSNSVNME